LVGRVSRVGDSVCARAFQAAVGCVDTARGQTVWTQRANGGDGVAGDGASVFGTESDGRVMAWKREDGQRAWTTDKLLHRNVGTSTLFNRLTKTRDAIVADFAGLTRDRHYGNAKQGRYEFIVIDTGGFEPTAEQGIYKEMAKQTQQAVAEADVVVFVVDARA